jgi:beta-glucosidase
LARKIAQNGIVLLKNENNILPLNYEIEEIAVLGPNAELKTSRGGGSSTNFPPYEITALQGIKEKCENKVKIGTSPSESDVSILFVGLNHEKNMDAEGTDKASFSLPKDHIELIKNTASKNPKIIVVLISGSPVSMEEWIDDVPVVIQAWYAGMEGGRAIADVIFGDVNPSGKLPITFPKKLSDCPAQISDDENIYYNEGIFVGYRHFDVKKIKPLFPFGHGLSYTSFHYDKIFMEKETYSGEENIHVSIELKNTGSNSGAEVVQLYLQDVESSLERPLKELKGFKKVFLEPGQKETIRFELMKEDLSFFHEGNDKWVVEDGLFKILIGSSSEDIRLKVDFTYEN